MRLLIILKHQLIVIIASLLGIVIVGLICFGLSIRGKKQAYDDLKLAKIPVDRVDIPNQFDAIFLETRMNSKRRTVTYVLTIKVKRNQDLQGSNWFVINPQTQEVNQFYQIMINHQETATLKVGTNLVELKADIDSISAKKFKLVYLRYASEKRQHEEYLFY